MAAAVLAAPLAAAAPAEVSPLSSPGVRRWVPLLAEAERTRPASGYTTHAGHSGSPSRDSVVPEDSLEGILQAAARILAYIVLAGLLFYASGGNLFVATVLQQAGHLPTSRVPLMVLFPNGFGKFDPDEVGHVELVKQDFLTLAVPWFLLSILWEAFIVCWLLPPRLRPLHTYRLNDSLMSLATGVLYVCITKVVFLEWGKALYKLIYQHARLTNQFSDIESPLSWWVGFFLADIFYYVYHRSSHWFSWLWASHVVHHSGEEYNLSTALRQPSNDFITPTTLIVTLPLAFLVPPEMAVFQGQFSLLYQFWIHTQLVPPLPLVELLFNTPSLHSVHHARNKHLLGKNYGSVLSVWDRIGGTFEAAPREGEPIYYGIIPPLNSWNPVWANIYHFQYMFALQRKWHGLRTPFLHWTPPNSRCPTLGMRLNPLTKYDVQAFSPWLTAYICLQFIVTALVGVYLSFADTTSWTYEARCTFYGVGFLFALVSFASMGNMQSAASLATTRRALVAEAFRQMILCVLAWGAVASIAFQPTWRGHVAAARTLLRYLGMVALYGTLSLLCIGPLYVSARESSSPTLVAVAEPSGQRQACETG